MLQKQLGEPKKVPRLCSPMSTTFIARLKLRFIALIHYLRSRVKSEQTPTKPKSMAARAYYSHGSKQRFGHVAHTAR